MIKLIHSADLHLDSPFEALPENLARARRGEQRELLERLVGLARDTGAKIILLAGDVLDTDSAYPETARLLCDVFSGTDARVFISPGNHDPATNASPYARLRPPAQGAYPFTLPDNVHIFMTNQIECVPIPELKARVWGAGFEQKFSKALLRDFRAEKIPGVADLMVLHGNAEKTVSPYNPITKQELAESGMDYVALGHFHDYSGLMRTGNTCYCYSGCPEGRGFDESGDKYALEVSVTAGSYENAPCACAVTTHNISSRRYELLEVDVTGSEDILDAVLLSLPEDTSRDIYRLILTGETESRPEIKALYETLSNRFFYLQLRDKTVPARDIWRSAGHDTLRGLFLSRMREKLDKAEQDADREKITLAVRCALAAMDGAEEPC